MRRSVSVFGGKMDGNQAARDREMSLVGMFFSKR